MNDTSADLEIRDVAYGGDGVGRLPDGRTAFVPFTAPGELVRVRVTGRHRRFVRAELLAVLTASPDRVAPRCPLYGRCGGCAYQHLSAAVEATLKAKQARDLLARVGRLPSPPLPELPAPAVPTWNYRNKLTLNPGPDGCLGYYAVDNRTVIPVKDCPLAMAPINAALQHGPRAKQPVTFRCDATGKAHRLGRHSPLLTELLLGHALQVPADGFYQVHPPVLDAMVRWLAKRLPRPGELLDAYCGVGVFALGLGRPATSVLGFDIAAASIACAQQNAAAWGLGQASFQAAAVAAALPLALAVPAPPGGRTVLLDPPRGGCEPTVLAALRQYPPDRLVYVSCHPDMLARDVARLGPGWHLAHLAVFNMFPQTAQFETVALLHRA